MWLLLDSTDSDTVRPGSTSARMEDGPAAAVTVSRMSSNAPGASDRVVITVPALVKAPVPAARARLTVVPAGTVRGPPLPTRTT